uniref:Uncharacterized protein n=1 Tax=Candidatus Kentrum sp. LFY TaxID=2126342 RepID=A0A450WFU6_9GAMM|nr:MAG: hypothetical protein BECKLFY1418C_GA0070996_101916 [Candidatus Kentron sp. LFY]
MKKLMTLINLQNLSNLSNIILAITAIFTIGMTGFQVKAHLDWEKTKLSMEKLQELNEFLQDKDDNKHNGTEMKVSSVTA